ncbi:MAG: DUF6447 family protein [Methylomonas sp.]|nr:DUF6447 family protein [Methylomonas sp.]
MAKITINNIAYDADNMSDQAKQQLNMLQITEAEIARLEAQLAIAQTAKIAYARALEKALPVSKEGLVLHS